MALDIGVVALVTKIDCNTTILSKLIKRILINTI